MIELHVEDYCQNCREFEAKTWIETIYNVNEEIMVETTVSCEHAHRCKQIHERMKRENDESQRRETTGS